MNSLTPKQIASRLVKTKKTPGNWYRVKLAGVPMYSTYKESAEKYRKRFKRKIIKALEAFYVVDIETAVSLLVSVRKDSKSMHDVYLAGELVDTTDEPRSTIRNRWKRKLTQILSEKAKV